LGGSLYRRDPLPSLLLVSQQMIGSTAANSGLAESLQRVGLADK